jgi:membrane protease subunit HflK
MTYDVVDVTSERTETIGAGGSSRDSSGLMLTTDANIVDVGFQVVWNVSSPKDFLFEIADPESTVQAVSESAMREVIAASNLAPILNRDRGIIAENVRVSIQDALDQYNAGISIVRVNLEKADPPGDVIDSFREVQAAEQQRDRLQREADAYANRVVAEARGQAEQFIQQAEGYRSQVVNNATGQASRFAAVQQEYALAPEVTRRRIYLETMEQVLGSVNKMVLDPSITGGEGGGTGVVPILPLDELIGRAGQNNAAAATGGN